MKNYCTLIALFLFSFIYLPVYAKSVSEEDARLAAKNFLFSQYLSKNLSFQEPVLIEVPIESEYFYIFEDPEIRSWVILSANDAITPIIGFSLEDKFRTSVSPVFNEWFKQMNDEAELIISHSSQLKTSTLSRQEWEILLGKRNKENLRSSKRVNIPALLGESLNEVRWVDGYKYQKFTPKKNSMQSEVGCVAIVSGNILKYWMKNNSINGKETFSYYDKYTGEFHSVDMRKTYDFSRMPNSLLNYDYNSKETDEIASLLVDLGMAEKMCFNYIVSGTALTEAASALYRHFDFTPGQFLWADSCETREEWEGIIYNELVMQRPIPYRALKNLDKTGHAFIIDGYDSQSNTFHVNWGLEALKNGYFKLSLDNTNSFLYEYQYKQGAIIGLEPNDGSKTMLEMQNCKIEGFSGSEQNNYIGENSFSNTTESSFIKIIPQIKNKGNNSFNGPVYLSFEYAANIGDEDFHLDYFGYEYTANINPGEVSNDTIIVKTGNNTKFSLSDKFSLTFGFVPYPSKEYTIEEVIEGYDFYDRPTIFFHKKPEYLTLNSFSSIDQNHINEKVNIHSFENIVYINNYTNELLHFSIYDINGSVIEKGTLFSGEKIIQLPKDNSKIYIVKTSLPEGTYSRKIIVK